MRKIYLIQKDKGSTCGLHKNIDYLVKTYSEPASSEERAQVIIYQKDNFNMDDICELLTIKKKLKPHRITLCSRRINSNNEIILRELGINFKKKKEFCCDHCKHGIDIISMGEKVINSLFGDVYKKSEVISNFFALFLQNLNDCNLKTIASELNLSPEYLSRLLKKHFNYSFRELLSEIRFEIAKEMLAENLTPYEIAEALGYNELNNFYRFFRKKANVSPQNFIRLTTSK